MTPDRVRELIKLGLDLTPGVPELGSTAPVRGLLGGWVDISSFQSDAWKIWKKLFKPKWESRGQFEGAPPLLEVRGESDYVYRRNPASPFSFISRTMGRVEPQTMATDNGSVPRVLWCIPGLNPWAWTRAFLIHDWIFTSHHLGERTTFFEEANLYIAEAIYTEMMDAPVRQDWRVVALIHFALSTPVARRVWDEEWTDAQKCLALNLSAGDQTPERLQPPLDLV